MRVLLVGSSGGHLLQMHRLKDWWRRHDRAWVTFEKPDALSLLRGERVYWAFHPTTRHLPNLVRNTLLARCVIEREQPDVILSTGAAVALPFFLLGKLKGIRTVYLEVFDRIDLPTVTGKLCYPLSDLFLLQWEEQKRFYPRGICIGPVF